MKKFSKDFAEKIEKNQKEYILTMIALRMQELDDQDATGHIYWAEFERFIKNILP